MHQVGPTLYHADVPLAVRLEVGLRALGQARERELAGGLDREAPPAAPRARMPGPTGTISRTAPTAPPLWFTLTETASSARRPAPPTESSLGEVDDEAPRPLRSRCHPPLSVTLPDSVSPAGRPARTRSASPTRVRSTRRPRGSTGLGGHVRFCCSRSAVPGSACQVPRWVPGFGFRVLRASAFSPQPSALSPHAPPAELRRPAKPGPG